MILRILAALLIISVPVQAQTALEPPALASPGPEVHPDVGDALRGLRVFNVKGSQLGFIGSACPVNPMVAYTSWHVVEGEERLFVAPNNGHRLDPTKLIEVVVYREDESRDLAMIRTKDPKAARFLFVYETSQPALPGTPIRYSLPLSDKRQAPVFARLLGVDATTAAISGPAAPGMSGGCVLDDEGKAFAILTGWGSWGPESWGRNQPLATIGALIKEGLE